MRRSEAKAGLTGTAILTFLLLPCAAFSEALIFTADTGNNRIQVFNREGGYIMQWGTYGSGDGQMISPVGIASGDSVYLADSGNHRIQEFGPDGAFRSSWGGVIAGTADGLFSNPSDVAVNIENCRQYVYVADTGNNRIQKFTASGEWAATWGGAGRFNSPQGIASCLSGQFIYVADTGNNKIQKLDINGNLILAFGGYGTIDGKMKFPRDIAVDSLGRVYVADSLNYRIQRFSTGGIFELKWGEKGAGDGQFLDHYGVAVDDKDNVYAADAGNNRIQVFTCDGVWLKTIGSGSSGTGDSEFYYPMGVDVLYERPVSVECMPTETFTGTFTETPADTDTETFTPSATVTPTDTAVDTHTATFTETPVYTAVVTPDVPDPEPPLPEASATFIVTPAATPGTCGICYLIEFRHRVKKTCDMPAVIEARHGKKRAAHGERLEIFNAAAGGYVYVLRLNSLKISVYDKYGCYAARIKEMERAKKGENHGQFMAWLVRHQYKKDAFEEMPPEYYGEMLFPDTVVQIPAYVKDPAPAEEMDGKNTYIYPNPCSGRSVIRFALPDPGAVDIVISNVAGKPVWHRHLRMDETTGGINYTAWDAVDDRGALAPNGTYILRVTSGGKKVVKKIAVSR